MNEESDIAIAAKIMARATNRFGSADAATPMGGLEALGAALGEKLERLSDSMQTIASAIDDVQPDPNKGPDIVAAAKVIARVINGLAEVVSGSVASAMGGMQSSPATQG